MVSDDVTIGEVYRLVRALKDEHGETLEEIRKQTTATNGKVIAHAGRLEVNDREIKGLKKNHERVVWAIFGLVLSIIGGIAVVVITR